MPTNYFKIGVFTITAFLLFVLAVVGLGLSNVFKTKLECVTYFDQSVQGLTVGSAVKFRGFSVGQVSDISLSHVRGYSGKQLIEVVFYVEPKNFMYDDEGKKKAKEFLDVELKNGLRTFIGFQGVTGISFLDLDYYDKAAIEELENAKDFGETVLLIIPPATGKVMEIGESVGRIVNSIEGVDFAGISHDLQSILEKLNDIVGRLQEGDLSNTTKDTLIEMQDAAQAFKVFMNSMDKTVVETDFKNMAHQTTEALKILQNNLSKVEKLLTLQQGNVPLIIENLKVSSENFKALSEIARKHPSWVLFGEAPKEVDPRAETNKNSK